MVCMHGMLQSSLVRIPVYDCMSLDLWQDTLKDTAKLYSLDKAMKVRPCAARTARFLGISGHCDPLGLGPWLVCCISCAPLGSSRLCGCWLCFRMTETLQRHAALHLQLYDLDSFELLWERREDTKVLLAWTADRMVMSFRGTASFVNVLADLQVKPGALQSKCLLMHDTLRHWYFNAHQSVRRRSSGCRRTRHRGAAARATWARTRRCMLVSCAAGWQMG